LSRAYRPTDEERLIRDFVLQLKRGSVRTAYFRDKFGVDVVARFGSELEALRREGIVLAVDHDVVALSRQGLLQVDAVLRRFFLPEHAGIRYS
jgi:oxygen-independent coproporphyrinogen-3 oxidase